jgi:hypothetical protein
VTTVGKLVIKNLLLIAGSLVAGSKAREIEGE